MNEFTSKIETDSQRMYLWLPVHTAIFKMDDQQGSTYCIAQGTLLNIMWQPGWEESLGEDGYMCVRVYVCVCVCVCIYI